MAYSKRLTASLFFLQVLFTQAKGSCGIFSLGTVLDCSGEEITNLSSALGKVTNAWTDSVVSLRVEHTEVIAIHENTTTKSFKELTIWYNKSLTVINPMAFPLANSSVEKLEISECPNLTDSVWGVVSKMSAMKCLTLDNTGITMVPDMAFGECKSLNEIYLSNNGITTFDASLGGLNLKKLDLQNNLLTIHSFSVGVFEGEGHLTELILWDNQGMWQLKESQFKGLLAKGTSVHVGRRQTTGEKYMECKGADWLCGKGEGGAYLHETVFGYNCAEPGFDTIVDYCESLQEANKL